MNKVWAVAKRYQFFLITLAMLGILTIFKPGIGLESIKISGFQMFQMLLIIPPVFILLGLLDVWVPRETMVRYMGEGSGVLGILLAFMIGSFAAGPLYGAFPVAAVFMKKGIKFSNLMIFIGAWATTKIPMLMFEMRYMGMTFTLTRLFLNIFGILVMAWLLNKMMPKNETESLYLRAK